MKKQIESQRAAARQACIDARNAWNDTRTASNPHGDPDLWANYCETKRVCALFGVIV